MLLQMQFQLLESAVLRENPIQGQLVKFSNPLTAWFGQLQHCEILLGIKDPMNAGQQDSIMRDNLAALL